MDELSLTPSSLMDRLIEDVVERIAQRLKRDAESAGQRSTPWLTTPEAIEYTRLPEGTFRKLMANGMIPSHGGHSKIFYRPELDTALLEFRGIANNDHRLNRVR